MSEASTNPKVLQADRAKASSQIGCSNIQTLTSIPGVIDYSKETMTCTSGPYEDHVSSFPSSLPNCILD